MVLRMVNKVRSNFLFIIELLHNLPLTVSKVMNQCTVEYLWSGSSRSGGARKVAKTSVKI